MCVSECFALVSIVSIQADQSRQQKYREALDFIKKFQSYQFRQINPDNAAEHSTVKKVFGFQSYQFRQINPDATCGLINSRCRICFNRINSGRSIPTSVSEFISNCLHQPFQSYQFRQINPGKSNHTKSKEVKNDVSIVSIQADQSRLIIGF